MSRLLIPGSSAPSNLHLRPDQVKIPLEGSVYEFCQRLREEVTDGDKLFIVIHEGNPKPFVIMERVDFGPDPGDRYVMRTAELDQRLITHLQRIRHIPLTARLAEAERVNAAYEKAHREAEQDEYYERVGGPMLRELDRNGFVAGGRGVSYPKRGPRAKRRTAAGAALP